MIADVWSSNFLCGNSHSSNAPPLPQKKKKKKNPVHPVLPKICNPTIFYGIFIAVLLRSHLTLPCLKCETSVTVTVSVQCCHLKYHVRSSFSLPFPFPQISTHLSEIPYVWQVHSPICTFLEGCDKEIAFVCVWGCTDCTVLIIRSVPYYYVHDLLYFITTLFYDSRAELSSSLARPYIRNDGNDFWQNQLQKPLASWIHLYFIFRC